MRPSASHARRAVPRLAALAAGLLLAGCAASGSQGSGGASPGLLEKLLAVAPPAESTPPRVETRGCGTPVECKAALKKMVDSPKRGWIGQEQAPAAYADGTRLFAYRALRRKMNCRELSLALSEVRAASKSLSGEVDGVSPDQLSRTRALNGQVERELAKERGVRCKG
jgi:hypothetical protein